MFRRMRGLFPVLICFLCLFSLLFLYGCGPSEEYIRLERQGYFPTAIDFPLSKWVCREADLYFYMLGDKELEMMGKYTVNGETYDVRASVLYNRMVFGFHSAPEIAASDYTDPDGNVFLKVSRNRVGDLSTYYRYENEIMTCKVFAARSDVYQKGDALTFERVGEIATQPEARWRCLELDLYLDSFSDAEDYFRGEIVLDGKRHTLQAYEAWGENYYCFSFNTRGVTSVSKAYSYDLFKGVFAFEEDRIVCTLTDDHLNSPKEYPYWTYPGAVLTFVKEPIPEA